MTKLETGQILQFRLWEPPLAIPNIENCPVGSYASEVASNILEAHSPQQIHYTIYDPESTYELSHRQPYFPSPWEGIKSLCHLSEDIYSRSSCCLHFEGESIILCNIIALCSLIKDDQGSYQHIPMLDFDLPLGSIEPISKLPLPHGIILKSGDSVHSSYHYFGLELMDQTQWSTWIRNLSHIDNDKSIFGKSYLDLCQARGYNALRIFGYPGTSKSSEPIVVAHV